MKKKIVLIGMMGSGKSTIGKILSKMLKFNFIDTDILIEKKCGLKITKIFDKYGEEYFRRKEEKIVSKILYYKSPFVISLGGGVFLNKNLQKQILKKTISIWLKPSFKTIYDRCKKSNHRPLIGNKNDLRFNLKKLIKNILIIIIFIPIKLFAQESLVNFSGNIQTGYNYYDNYSFAPYFDKDTNEEYSAIARIIIESNNYDNFSYEMHVLQTYNYSDIKTGVSGRSLSMLSADLGEDWIKNNDESAHYYIDRANVKFTTKDLDICLGRLAISFGKPQFWNLFDYYGSSYLNQDFKSGIDAVRIDKSFTNFSGANIVVNKIKKYNESGNYLENTLAQSYQRIGLEREVGFLLRGYQVLMTLIMLYYTKVSPRDTLLDLK